MNEDPEIHGLLRNLQGTPNEQAAWSALQRYRAEALAGARDGADRQAKELLVSQARQRLRATLMQLLAGPQPVGPAVQEVLRTVALREHADAVLDVRDRARRAWEEMLGREVRLLVFDGFSPRLAEQAAANNLALRRKELEDEVITELARLQGELRKKLQRLAEDAEDAE